MSISFKKYKSGLTLVEAVVSMLILGIAVGAMLGVLMIGEVSTVKAKHHIEAMNLLRLKMEELKNTRYDDIASVTAQNISIDIGQDLIRGTSDDLWGIILVEARDKNDIDGDGNTTEAEIDSNGDGINDSCKPIYATISWTYPSWGGSSNVSEELVTLICK
jgi:type II secretory pathway pseudopilin PulG